MIDLGGAIYNG